jgi:TetR/AcrR family transcriptional repressor of nem operon
MPWEKQFDIEEVREKAMVAFWTRGYDNTSMQELLDAMGIQRGSFYDTFKSKHQVLLEALRRYDSGRRETFSELGRGRSARGIIKTLFQSIAGEAQSDNGRRGCLLVNCALELAPRDAEVAEIVNRAFDETRTFFQSAIERGQETGEIPKTVNARETAQTLLGLLLGMRVLARAGSTSAVKAIAGQAAALLE